MSRRAAALLIGALLTLSCALLTARAARAAGTFDD